MTAPTLVSCALPYANGPVHLGHLVEHVQTDIYVRALRSTGADVVFVCADDTHGAPIELNALKQGLSPEAFVATWFDEHTAVFRDFHVSHDHYGSTNSPENQHYANLIYERAKAAGSIGKKDVEQPYDAKAGRWLSDRFIRGTCPNCGAKDQYGDACEVCNAAYTPRELKDARSAISGEPLEWKKSSHAFFLLSKHGEFLTQTIRDPAFMNPGPAAQLGQFFEKGLADWDITRDGPYFGFPIPGETNQFFYVWLDAPIGYIAATEQWAKKTGRASSALDFWAESSDACIVHSIGKDIVYFHCLFWPAVLKVAQLKRPARVNIHGHLTVNGEKMSKSRGTFINARAYLDRLDPNYLRFYFASLLGNGPEDLDLSLKEFRERTNAELVNNLGNLANRTLSLLVKEFSGRLAAPSPALGRPLVEGALAKVPAIRAAFLDFDPRTAVKLVLELGYAANQFLTAHEPWKKLKVPESREHAHQALSEAAEVVYLLTALLEPIVPQLAERLAGQLARPGLTFRALEQATYPVLDRGPALGVPAPLIARLEAEQVDALVVTAPVVPKAPERASAEAPKPPPAAAAELEFSDFTKVSLKAGRVLACERVPKADKLLKLTVDLGEAAPRTIVSGIAEAYAPEAVTGRAVVVVANLKPRALKGIESRGMILTAGRGGKDLVLLDPGDVPPGAEVK
ncbi:MAG: methionine--tRNA ligase [Myxococcaceae bacterium]|nr:methionine--tRNA ligase [Myxococcaceae bacterium]